MPGPKPIEPIERFHPKWKLSTEHSYEGTPCWEWTAAKNKQGYGQFKGGKTMVKAHRFSYEHYREPIPAGLELDHLCRVRHCVSPLHLEPVTHKANILRGDTLPARNARKAHCPCGRPYDYVCSDGKRKCKTCRRAADQHRRDQRRTA